MLYEEWKSRYKNLKNFNTVLQRCPRFWPLAPPRGMNPGVYSLGISEDPPRYLSSKFDASVRSDCWDISIWKTLTQCDGNGNANDRGDYNSSPCTSYRRAKNTVNLSSAELAQRGKSLRLDTVYIILINKVPYLSEVLGQTDLKRQSDAEQIPQNAASGPGQYCLPHIQQYLDTHEQVLKRTC